MADLNSSPSTPQPTRMCVDCKALTTQPIPVHSVDRTSGPSWTVYACVDCAPAHFTPTTSLLMLFDHSHPCPDCTPVDSCPMGYALARVHGRVLRRQNQPTKSAS